MRAILEDAVKPEGRVGLGSLLAGIGRRAGLSDTEVATLLQARDGIPAEPVDLE